MYPLKKKEAEVLHSKYVRSMQCWNTKFPPHYMSVCILAKQYPMVQLDFEKTEESEI